LKTNFFFCKNLLGKTIEEEIFRSKDEYIIENNLRYEFDCVSICTDGAASMSGKVKGFKAKVLETNPEIRCDHNFLHREATVAKMLPVPLQSLLDKAVKIVNFLRFRPLNSCLFSAVCQEMRSDHIPLLSPTEITWLSRGKSLSRVFELHDELRTFLTSHNCEYATSLSDESWVAKLAYLSDIFFHLNELNRKMQGKGETIFSTTDEIECFKGRLKLWSVYLGKGSTEISFKFVLIRRECYVHTINCKTLKYPSQKVR
jgi:hypothetical protein